MESVSVVIPALNASLTLNQTLASVAYQTRTVEEVVIVDNGSTDNTVAIAKRWDAHLPIKIIKCGVAGSGAARNLGAKVSTGTLLAFLDADDLWHPEKLSRQIETLMAGQKNICGAYFEYITPTGKVLGQSARFKSSSELNGAIQTAAEMPFPTSSLLLRKSDFLLVGEFDETFRRAQDFEWLVRASRHLRMCVPNEDTLLSYLVHGASSTAASYVEQYLAAELVRERLRLHSIENRTYEQFVLGKISSQRIPRKARAGLSFRTAGVSIGSKTYLKFMQHLLHALALDPYGTLQKVARRLVRQNVGKQSAIFYSVQDFLASKALFNG